MRLGSSFAASQRFQSIAQNLSWKRIWLPHEHLPIKTFHRIIHLFESLLQLTGGKDSDTLCMVLSHPERNIEPRITPLKSIFVEEYSFLADKLHKT